MVIGAWGEKGAGGALGWKGCEGALVDMGLIFRLSEQGLEEMRIGGRSGTVL